MYYLLSVTVCQPKEIIILLTNIILKWYLFNNVEPIFFCIHVTNTTALAKNLKSQQSEVLGWEDKSK